MSWLDDPALLMQGIPPAALLVFVFVSAAVEYVFPPYLGDMAVLLGFFLAGQGAAPPEQVYLAAVLGGPLGAWGAYLLGQRYGLRLIRWISRWRISLFRRRPLIDRQRLVDLFQRFDERWLAVNRFIPFLRSAALFGAGALELRLVPSLVYATLSHMAFMALMLQVGLFTSGSWDQILATARHYNQLIGLLVVAGLTLWIWYGMRRTAAQEPTD